MRGLIIGRFQPFHLGHLDLVRQALAECDEVIIGVTSSQFNYIQKDPFTAGERIEMIRSALLESDIDIAQCIILGIENQPNNALWASYLGTMLPKFELVYSGNEYATMLLADAGYSTAAPKLLDRAIYSSTRIRRMIANDRSWEQLVPSAVCRMILEIDGSSRIKILEQTDTKPMEY